MSIEVFDDILGMYTFITFMTLDLGIVHYDCMDFVLSDKPIHWKYT